MATPKGIVFEDFVDETPIASQVNSTPLPINEKGSKKRLTPESPEDLPVYSTRQIKRRNSLTDLSSFKSILPTKSKNKTSERSAALKQTIADTIINALSSPDVIDKIVPILSDKLSATITKVIESQMQSLVEDQILPLKQKVQEQENIIKQQDDRLSKLGLSLLSFNKNAVKNRESIAEYDRELDFLYRKIDQLETRLENQEQYSRRTSLRFHNVRIPFGTHSTNTDNLILKICNEKMNLNITHQDIGRSHVIGAIHNGRAQVIVRFISYRTREMVYNSKKNLKGDGDKIFITENLTKFRNDLVKELSILKNNNDISAYWTYNGRIYAKKNEMSAKQLIRTHDDIKELLSSTYEPNDYDDREETVPTEDFQTTHL